MSSVWKSKQSQTAPENDAARPIPQNPSQTPVSQRRHYFPAGSRLVAAKTQDIDSGLRLQQRQAHAFRIMGDDGILLSIFPYRAIKEQAFVVSSPMQDVEDIQKLPVDLVEDQIAAMNRPPNSVLLIARHERAGSRPIAERRAVLQKLLDEAGRTLGVVGSDELTDFD